MAMVAAAAGVAWLQPALAGTVHQVKERDDVVAFPPPVELHVAVLGWDAAAVDLLWADLLVQYGLHFSEHREFTQIPRYVDAILELEPTYQPMYKTVDTLLAYRPLQGTESDVRLARAYLERGTRECPDNANVWLWYGEFIAFLAPSFLSEAEGNAWRKDGAIALERAAELGAPPDRALSAAGMLTRAGETHEAVRFLERAYAFTEHPAMREVHAAIGERLEALSAVTRRDAADAVARVIDDRWSREMPGISRSEYLLLGPISDATRCAGLDGANDLACARSWSDVTDGPGSSGDSP
jgi:hypothetical protein